MFASMLMRAMTTGELPAIDTGSRRTRPFKTFEHPQGQKVKVAAKRRKAKIVKESRKKNRNGR